MLLKFKFKKKIAAVVFAAVSLFCLTYTAVLYGMRAKAANEISVEDLFSVETANLATCSGTGSAATPLSNGVLLSENKNNEYGAWSVGLKGVFDIDNTNTIEFQNIIDDVTEIDDPVRNFDLFTIRVSDYADPSKFFDVEVASMTKFYLAVGVIYEGKLYTTSRSGKVINVYNSDPNGVAPERNGALVWAARMSHSAEGNGVYPKITFTKKGSVFSVTANAASGGKLIDGYTIAKFGQSALYGLPDISEILPSGKFTMNFSSGAGSRDIHLTRSVLMHSINGVNLGQTDSVEIPGWHNTELTYVNYVYPDNFDRLNLKYNPNPIAFGAGELLLKPLALTHGDVFDYWRDANGNKVEKIIYENDKTVSLTAGVVVHGKQPVENLFTKINGGVVTAGSGTGENETKSNVGVLLSPEGSAQDKKFVVGLNRLFRTDEDNRLDFLLVNSLGRRGAKSDLFNIRVVDATDDRYYFDIKIIANSEYYAECYVSYVKNGKENVRSTIMKRNADAYSSFLGDYSSAWDPDKIGFCWAVQAYLNGAYNGRYCSVSLKPNGNKLGVYANFLAGAAWHTRLIAEFDGTDKFENMVSFGLPFIREVIPSGKYRFEFSSGIDRIGGSRSQMVSSVLINSAGDYVFGNRVSEYEPEWYSEYASFENRKDSFIRVDKSAYTALYVDSLSYVSVPYGVVVGKDGTTTPVEKVELKRADGEWRDITRFAGQYIEPLSVAGDYTLRYVGVIGNENENNVYEIPFKVIDGKTESKTLTVNGRILSTQSVNDGVYIPTASFVYNDYAELLPRAVKRILIKRASGQVWSDITDYADKTFSQLSEGKYVLRYEAVENGVDSDNFIEYEFTAYENAFDLSSLLIKDKNAEYLDEYDADGRVGTLIGGGKNAVTSVRGVFTGDTSVKLSFPTSANGSYYVRFQSACDETDYFFVAINKGAVYVIDKFASAYGIGFGGAIIKSENHFGYNNSLRIATSLYGSGFSDGFKVCKFGAAGENYCVITINYDGDILTVKASGKTAEKVLARFDGTSAVDNTSSPKKYGLEKVDFKSGYIISFENLDVSPVSVLLEEIGGVTFERKYQNRNFRIEKQWEKDFENGVKIVAKNFVKKVYDAKVVVPEVSAFTISDGKRVDIKELRIEGAGSSFGERVTEGQTVYLESGEYALICSTDKNVSGGRRTLYFTVVNEGIGTDKFFKLDKGTLAAGYVAGGKYDHSGVLVRQSENGTFSGKFNGVFSGSTSITFVFPDGETFAGKSMTFRVYGKADPSEYFDFCLFDGSNGMTGTYVKDNRGNIRSYHTESATKYGLIDKYINPLCAVSAFGGTNWRGATLALIWEGDVLSVIVKGSDTRIFGTMYLARFDGSSVCSESVRDNDGKPSYALNKLSFKDGYEISFYGSNTDVLFEELGTYASFAENRDVVSGGRIIEYRNGTVSLIEGNGVNLYSDGYGEEVYDDAGIFRCLNADNLISETVLAEKRNGTVKPIDIGAGVYFEYELTPCEGFKITDRSVYYYKNDEAIDASDEKTLSQTFTKFGLSVTQTIKIVKSTPKLALLSGDYSLTLAKGPNENYFEISSEDAYCHDLFDGIIGDIKISVKKPDETEFTTVQSGKYYPDAVGVYTVRYSATNSDGVTGYVDKTVKVIDAIAPKITVDGEIIVNNYHNNYLYVPSATAKAGNETVSVTVSVIFDGVKLEIKEGKVLLSSVGTYIVSYYAVNGSNGLETLISFEVFAARDNEPPVIGDINLPDEVKTGSEIVLPKAQISDNADESPELTITVKFGKETINVENGKFVAEKEGSYLIKYSVKDKSGNTTEVTYAVIANK